jgi:DNA replication protein DnaC
LENINFTRATVLNTIPNKKLQDSLLTITNSTDTKENKFVKSVAINRYAESNIPIEYWELSMEKSFVGDPRLKSKFEEYTKDIKNTYCLGSSLCLAGSYGLGKTLTLNSILKKAALKGYSCLYSDLSNIVSIMLSAESSDKFLAKRELSMVDFLAIDEVDQRFFNASNNSNETFARNLEFILRARLSNKLPTLLATNSPAIKETFVNLFKDSLGSIMSKIEMFVVMPGNDFRKEV